MIDLIIPPDAIPYIEIQIGAVSHRIGDDAGWNKAVREFIDDQVNSLMPCLYAAFPQAKTLLSIGAGMGYIELMIQRLWSMEGRTLACSIVDGTRDQPLVKYHRETFSHAGVAREFWAANGGEITNYIDPGYLCPDAPLFDIVLGLGSWGFHFTPRKYLAWAMKHMHPGTILVMDNRKGKPEWKEAVEEHFDFVDILQQDEKRERIWWKPKTKTKNQIAAQLR